jgi:uncharacterized protein (DUF1499 family)
MRRIIIEEPLSASALWSRRLAVFALALAAIGVALARARPGEALAGLSVLSAAIVVALTALLFAGAAAVIIWRTGRRGVGETLGALALAALLLAYPAYMAVQSIRLPLINDVTTDLTDPPDFSRSSAALAARGERPGDDTPESMREEQRRAYPDIQPIVLDLEADDAFALVRRAVAALGWRIVAQTRPGGRTGVGHIDAVDHSLIMGFPSDVTIRIRPLAGQTRIDIRSASRYGRHDFGANARRIRKFGTELQAQLDAR